MEVLNPSSLMLKDFLPLIGTGVAAFIAAALGGYLGPRFLEGRRRKWETRNLALAFGGEIKALQQIVKIRRYEEGIHQYIERMRTTGQPFYIRSRIQREYFGVYKENLGRLGILDAPLPEHIAAFYTMANAILEDIDNVRDPANEEVLTPEILIGLYEQLLQLFHKVMSLSTARQD
jgi:hypothetical protein